MHTLFTRGNAIVAYTLSVSACLTFCCFLSTVFIDYRANASLNTVKVVVKNVPDYSASREKNDLGFLTFDLQTDLTPLFNWNVKQLFLYLTAEYETEANKLNQIVLWDKIVLRGDNAVLDFKNMNTKYYFWDDGNGLRGNKNVTLTLSWNIIPNAGLLPSMSLTFQQIICDAKKLVGRISDHENTADNLISEIQSVCNQIDDMKQYQEEVDLLNTEAKQRPHNSLIAGIQQETRHLREVQAENKELRNALEDHQNALELIMSKYRQQTASLIRKSRTDVSALHNSKYANIITSQAEKINEMATVMRVAAALDEESELKYKENYSRLKEENNVLREIVNIANKYGSLNTGPPVDHKNVQTEPS